jgi:hypothetical protein
LIGNWVSHEAAIGEHVARVNLFGQSQHKGLGITSAHALEAGIKTSTLLRLLNDTAQPAVSELAAEPMRAINVRRQPPAGQPYNGRQPALNGSHFPALHKGATAALAKCDGLTRPSRSWKTTNACLQGHHLAEALRTKLTDAQEAAMQGDPTAVQVALTALLTPAAAKLVSMIHAQGKQKLAISITGALLQELCGPHSYMYVTRHTPPIWQPGTSPTRK